MRIKILILTALLCAIGLTGCKEDPKLGSPMTVKLYGVSGRADLETGMSVGLFVSEPVYADNVPLVISSNGGVVTEKDLRWAYDQAEASRFFAYAPYDASFTGKETAVLDIVSDQSSKHKFLSANIMTALTAGAPGQQAVTLRLKHVMTAMMVTFDNRTGAGIESLTVTGLMTQGKLDFITGTFTATGSKSRITPLRDEEGGDSFVFLYPPQDGTPVFHVILTSGKEIDITYKNYCHEYSGSIVKMDRIVLTESTPTENILDLDGVNITQWNVNGVPSFSESAQYLSLAGLINVETDKDDNFFSAYINKVTVTAVDNTNPAGQGLILEDSTCAIYAWAYEDPGLKVGNTIVGPVMGYMDKPSDSEFHISNFYTAYATIGKTDNLPCTAGSFKTLADNIGRLEYRRMKFEGTVLKQRFENGRAVFEQDGTEMSVICAGFQDDMRPGVSGDLIGFPVRNGSDVVVMIFDPEQFNGFVKSEIDNAFAADSILGLYELSDTANAVYCFPNNGDEPQYSLGYRNSDRSMQVVDTEAGVAQFYYIYNCPDIPVIGHEYCVSFNISGQSEMRGSTIYMECVKYRDGRAWFIDRSGSKGLILAL